MFKFLFGDKGKVETVQETQRQTATRALEELNTVLAGLDEMPQITLAPGSALISIALPEQMPDEAVALPAPSPEELSPTDTSDDTAATDAPKAA